MVPETRPIQLDDKETIDRIRKQYGHSTSSHCFPSLYIWKDDMRLSVYIEKDFFAVKNNLERDNEWFFPCGDPGRIEWFLNEVDNTGLSLRYLRGEDAALLEKICPGRYSVFSSPGDNEYLYDTREQIGLSGKKLRTVRNHINRVQKDHELRYEAITDSNMDAVMHVSDLWVRKSTEMSSLEDVTASCLLLKERKALEVMGVLVYVDDSPYAIVAGYPISDSCFDMAMAKQIDTLPGLTSYAKYAMYNTLPERYETVNAEEDLDIPGLRALKQQMGPVGVIEMFKAFVRGE